MMCTKEIKNSSWQLNFRMLKGREGYSGRTLEGARTHTQAASAVCSVHYTVLKSDICNWQDPWHMTTTTPQFTSSQNKIS